MMVVVVLMIVRTMAMGMIAVMRMVVVVMRMIVMMIVGMIMMVIVVVPVVVVVMMIVLVAAMRRAGIGAAFRVERPLDGDDFRAEAARHVLDHMVAPDPERASRQLDRQVTIAEMPGDPRQRDRVLAADLGERLRRRDHFDDAAVLQRETVAGAQHQSLGQIEQEGEALDAGHRDAAAMTIVIIEHDGIGGRAGPGAGGANGAGGEHRQFILEADGNVRTRFGGAEGSIAFPLPGLGREEKPGGRLG